MRRVVIGLIVVGLLASAAFALRGRGAVQGVQSPEATPLPAVEASSEVVADAVVVPVQHADLSLTMGGTVAEVLVAEGDTVEAGQLLLRLEAPKLEAAVAQAEATLQQAKAGLAQAATGRDRAQAALERAEASLAKLQAGAREEELAAARATLAAAQAALQRLNEGASAEEIAASRAALDIAQAELARVQRGPTEDELISARTAMEKAQRAVQQAQAAYDQVAHREDIGALPQSLQLEQATLDLQAAQARYQELTDGADAEDIAVAQARVRQAEANLAQVAAGPRAAQIAAAQAEIDRAQAQLDLLAAGARPEELRIAETEVASAQSEVASAEANVESARANVAAAEAGLAQAEAGLADAALVSPLAGTVALLDVTVGEQLAPATIVARVADLSAWQIETDDLTELSVVRIEEGDPVTIQFDALPEVEISGVVTRIRPIGENKQGDITYTVVVTPDEQDERLRWNMTATVVVDTEA